MGELVVQVAVSTVKLSFIVIVSLLVSAGVWAADHKDDTLPNFDKRVATPGERSAKGAAGLAAHTQLRTRVADVRVETDPIIGSPKFISSPRGLLSGQAGAGAGVPAAALRAIPAADPHRAVKAFLRAHPESPFQAILWRGDLLGYLLEWASSDLRPT